MPLSSSWQKKLRLQVFFVACWKGIIFLIFNKLLNFEHHSLYICILKSILHWLGDGCMISLSYFIFIFYVYKIVMKVAYHRHICFKISSLHGFCSPNAFIKIIDCSFYFITPRTVDTFVSKLSRQIFKITKYSIFYLFNV